MKKLNLALALVFLSLLSNAQANSGKKENPDTLRVGNIIIIKKHKSRGGDEIRNDRGSHARSKNKSKFTTNWVVVDLGFSNFTNNTNFVNANMGQYLQPGVIPFSKSDFKLRDGKSINVNIWLFMQQIDFIKRNVGIKYGLGVELNNYRFKNSSLLSFKEDGIPYPGSSALKDPFIFRDSIAGFSKNKLALDYITVPFMLNFQTTPRPGKPKFNVAFGVSAGYLYSSRNKQVSAERGKERNRGDYDFQKFKISYIGELGLGYVKLYGSYSPNSMFESTTRLDFNPYTLGIRFGY